jgi:hypothetical protein
MGQVHTDLAPLVKGLLGRLAHAVDREEEQLDFLDDEEGERRQSKQT